MHQPREGCKIVFFLSDCRVFSRGSGGGRRPPPDFGGKFVPPRGGDEFLTGKKGYGGWLGVTRTDPHLGHHVRRGYSEVKFQTVPPIHPIFAPFDGPNKE